jgi:IS5 family transposase
MKRGLSVKPEIGHQNADCKIGRNQMKGMCGDAQNVVLYALGHNFLKILAYLRDLFVLIWTLRIRALGILKRPMASESYAA